MDKRKLPNAESHGALPPDLPSVDVGWGNMIQKLESEMPEGAVALPPQKSGKEKTTWRKYSLLALIFLLATTAIWTLWPSVTNDGGQQQPGATTISAGQKNETGTASNATQQTNKPGIRSETGDSETHAGLIAKEQNIPDDGEKESADVANSNKSLNPSASRLSSSNKRRPDRTNSYQRYAATGKGNSRKTKGRNAGKGNIVADPTGVASVAATQNEPANSPDASSSVDTKQTLNDSTTKPEIAKVDSAAQPAPEAVSKEEIKFSAGLFWALQLPTYSSSDYFTGPNAKAQYYRILLPGIYLRAEVDRSAFTVEANPFFTNLMPDKTYLTNSSSTNLGDTVIISKETRTMRKSFGFAAAISYDYNLRNQWWVGGGFQWQLLRDGVAKIDGEEERRATNGSGKVTRTYSETIAMTENDWQYFQKTYLGLNGHILYKSARWQTGLRVSYPITPLSKNGGPQFPLRSEVFFRLPVFKFGYK